MSPPGRITRTDIIVQSLQDYLRNQLFNVRGYPQSDVEIVDAFEEDRFREGDLDKNYITIGFNYDDGGEQAEAGSDLMRRKMTIEVWIIATTPNKGENLAYAVKGSLDGDMHFPIKDYRDPATPIIDYLDLLNSPRVERQPIPNPQAWQRNLWIDLVPVLDEYYAGDW